MWIRISFDYFERELRLINPNHTTELAELNEIVKIMQKNIQESSLPKPDHDAVETAFEEVTKITLLDLSSDETMFKFEELSLRHAGHILEKVRDANRHLKATIMSSYPINYVCECFFGCRSIVSCCLDIDYVFGVYSY